MIQELLELVQQANERGEEYLRLPDRTIYVYRALECKRYVEESQKQAEILLAMLERNPTPAGIEVCLGTCIRLMGRNFKLLLSSLGLLQTPRKTKLWPEFINLHPELMPFFENGFFTMYEAA